ncbi:MAG: GlsB/YeaQ/YmgE family stress response membrane protein [Hyphomicrobiales bacterium]
MAQFMTMPGVGLIGFLIIGIVAGFIAEKVMAANHGLLMNLVVGVAGSFIGGWLAGVLGIAFGGWIGNLVVATIGAVILLFVYGKLRQR